MYTRDSIRSIHTIDRCVHTGTVTRACTAPNSIPFDACLHGFNAHLDPCAHRYYIDSWPRMDPARDRLRDTRIRIRKRSRMPIIPGSVIIGVIGIRPEIFIRWMAIVSFDAARDRPTVRHRCTHTLLLSPSLSPTIFKVSPLAPSLPPSMEGGVMKRVSLTGPWIFLWLKIKVK